MTQWVRNSPPKMIVVRVFVLSSTLAQSKSRICLRNWKGIICQIL